ncbi:Protein vip1 [Coemansia guatemalensis]|uniref:Protein vip1 n=1 Tax=Coemansia guatemalensis TaxID=2761395 RepID=A0A9W8LR23_9FUNG|nr:Protein vip1 [Coemansia guatemalensis]
MVSTNWNTKIPTTPDPTYIEVDHIALSADEKTVQEAFAFCGKIDSLELQKQENGYQRALIKFSTVEAAKTALLLSSVLINHEAIEVNPLFREAHPTTPPSGPGAAQGQQPPQISRSGTAADTNYEGKPALYVAHELLAAGHMLGERVLARASQFDAKYRVTDRTQTQARSMDNQYKFSSYLQQWDDKFKISNRAKNAYDKIQSNSVGQKFILTVNDAYQSALQLSKDARDIAERKRANDERLFGKIPLPRAPSSTSAGPSSTGPSPQARTGTDYSSSPVPPTGAPEEHPNEKR